MCSLQGWSWDQRPVMLIEGSTGQWCCSWKQQWCWSWDQRPVMLIKRSTGQWCCSWEQQWCWSWDQWPVMLIEGSTAKNVVQGNNKPTTMLIEESTNSDVDLWINQQWCWSKDQPVNSVVDCGINKSKVLLINRSTKDKYCWSRDQQNEVVDRVVGLNNKNENEKPVLCGWKWMKCGKF